MDQPVNTVEKIAPAADPSLRPRPSSILVCMPFYTSERPSLALGLLAAIARRHGFPAETLHLTLDFAASIGAQLYEEIGQHIAHEFGNWLFSQEAFGEAAPDRDGRMLARFA